MPIEPRQKVFGHNYGHPGATVSFLDLRHTMSQELEDCALGLGNVSVTLVPSLESAPVCFVCIIDQKNLGAPWWNRRTS
jgi:hypothetical protein